MSAMGAFEEPAEVCVEQVRKRKRETIVPEPVIDVDDMGACAGNSSASSAGSDARLKAVRKRLRKLRQSMAELRAEEAVLVAEEKELEETIADAEALLSRKAAAAQDWCQGFEWDAVVDKFLLSVFGHKGFRPLQREAINAILHGRHAFAVMPTGSGKSLCYQLPAVLWTRQGLQAQGTTLVISPLLALMHDQVRSMRAVGIDARMLNSDIDKNERKDVLNTIGSGQAALVYTTPEFLAKSKILISKLQQAWKAQRFRLIAVDEAHCCSQWGHEFRPDYLKLKILREHFPSVPMLALTATATEGVQRDVEMQLDIRGCLLLRGRYNRPNLFYAVSAKPDKKEGEIDWLAQFILKRHPGHAGLVYCLSCRDVDNVAEGLRARGIKAVEYHSQRMPQQRQAAYSHWVDGIVQVVVATIAFGMGIDKADVRFVIHHALPKSVENYYQESGRAGRDGLPADCILLFRPADVQRLTSMAAENTNRDRNVGLVHEMLLCIDSPGNMVCRRKALAKYFGDTWQAADCNRFCDVCMRATAGFGMRDVSKLAKAVLRIVADALNFETGDKLTVIKAIDVARSDAAASRRLRGGRDADEVCRAATPRDIERVLVRLLAEGYLHEEFVFTAYSANGYLRLTARGRDIAKASMAPLDMKLVALPSAEELQLPSLAK